MRYSSLLLAVLFLESESCVALPWSKDGIVHWLLQRQLNNVIAHTESSAGLLDFLTSTSSTPTSTSSTIRAIIPLSSLVIGIAHTEIVESPTKGGPQPGVAHTEDPIPIPQVTVPSLGGSNAETAHEEQPVPTTTAKSFTIQAPYIEATITPTPSKTAHTAAATPPPTSHEPKPPSGGSYGGNHGSSSSGHSSSSSGHAGSANPPTYAGGADKGDQPSTPPAYDESSSGNESPDLGAPGSATAPAPVVQISSSPPVVVSGTTGAFNLGDVAYSFSAIPGTVGGSHGVSAVVVGSQTATPGQTLTINSQEVVVSATGSSLYFAPVITVTPEPALPSVTKVWTEGGKTVTGVFAAPSGTAVQSKDSVTSSVATAKEAKATGTSEEESGTASSPPASGITTTTTPGPSGGSSSTSASSSGAPATGDAQKAISAISGGVVATLAGLALAVLL